MKTHTEIIASLQKALEQCLSDLTWAQDTVPNTNFKSSILLARSALKESKLQGLNPNEAPEGYIATHSVRCQGCAFLHDSGNCATSACFPQDRNDKCNVIFKKKD